MYTHVFIVVKASRPGPCNTGLRLKLLVWPQPRGFGLGQQHLVSFNIMVYNKPSSEQWNLESVFEFFWCATSPKIKNGWHVIKTCLISTLPWWSSPLATHPRLTAGCPSAHWDFSPSALTHLPGMIVQWTEVMRVWWPFIFADKFSAVCDDPVLCHVIAHQAV